MKKATVKDERILMEFRKLAEKVYGQNGMRLNADQAVKTGDRERLRVWEKTILKEEGPGPDGSLNDLGSEQRQPGTLFRALGSKISSE